LETLESLSDRIDTTEEIGAIVSTMKSLSAASIRQYERAMGALVDYHRTIELGLQVVLGQGRARLVGGGKDDGRLAAVVFGSDRGLCGRFNERVTARLEEALAADEGGAGRARPLVLVVGLRAAARLEATGRSPDAVHPLPGAVGGLTRTARTILVELDRWRAEEGVGRVIVAHNRRAEGATAETVVDQLLPLPPAFTSELAGRPWPTRQLPAFRMDAGALFSWLVREHLLVSLFRAGAESLASEHASRLAAMNGAERNIAERLEELTADYRRKRQEAITTELLDIVTGVEAMRRRSEPQR
jgi:F-type H+-transporting ATPase subunit gamma